MEQPVRTSSNFRRGLDQFLWMSTLALLGSVMVAGNHWLSVNRSSLETKFFPVTTDHTFQDWAYDPVTGFPSAVVYLFKARDGCVYEKDQIETAIGITPEGDIVEALIRYEDDPSPGSNRDTGWQRLDARVVYMSETLVPGTSLRGSTIHDCHEGQPTVTRWGPVVIGEDMALPDYVQAWYEAGRKGQPRDYR